MIAHTAFVYRRLLLQSSTNVTIINVTSNRRHCSAHLTCIYGSLCDKDIITDLIYDVQQYVQIAPLGLTVKLYYHII